MVLTLGPTNARMKAYADFFGMREVGEVDRDQLK
jgi:hypothetical protein